MHILHENMGVQKEYDDMRSFPYFVTYSSMHDKRIEKMLNAKSLLLYV